MEKKVFNEYEVLYMYRQQAELALHLMIQEYRLKIMRTIRQYDHFAFGKNGDELYQLALIKLLDAMDCYRIEVHVCFPAYYARVLRNVMLDFSKKHQRYQKQLDEYTQFYGFEICDEHGHYLNQEDYFKKPSERNAEDIVMHLVADVDGKQRAFAYQVFMLRYLGYGYKEIAEKVGASVSAVAYFIRKMRRNKDRID